MTTIEMTNAVFWLVLISPIIALYAHNRRIELAAAKVKSC